MRQSIWILIYLLSVCPFCCLNKVWAEQKFPYVGYTSQDKVQVRCGPGEDFYVTELLESGTKVDVYQSSGDRWLAIRPPLGSFSWVAASQLRMTDDAGIAELIVESVISRIGSNIETVTQHQFQIKLKQGELVEVLGVQQREDENGHSQAWYKIAPPAGEFRWIDARLVTSKPTIAISKPKQNNSLQTTSSVKTVPITFGEVSSDSSSSDEKAEQPTSKSNGPYKSVQFVARGQSAKATRPTKASQPAKTDDKKVPAQAPTAETFIEKLNQLDVNLSALVVQDPLNWEFGPLLEQAEKLIESGSTALERSRARLLLGKIAEFERLQRRRANLEPVPASTSFFGLRSNARERNVGTFNDNAITGDFDGSGWLMPVHSQSRPAPPYALMSSSGKVLQYITPAAGVNLHRYLHQRVGIQGRRGYVSSLGTPHLTAQRVKVLGARTVR